MPVVAPPSFTLAMGLTDAVSKKPLPAMTVVPPFFNDVFGVAEVTVGAVLSITIANPPALVSFKALSVTMISPPKSPEGMVKVI